MADKKPGLATSLFRQLDPLTSALRSARRSNADAKPAKSRKAPATGTKKRRKSVKKTSPLAPKSFPSMPQVGGLKIGVAQTGIKYKRRPDLLFMEFAPGATAAGVFTKSTCPGVPVDWSRGLVDTNNGMEEARVLVANAGNSNVFTGQSGRDTVRATAAAAAKVVGCRQKDVLIASTGVIGEKPPTRKIALATGRAARAARGSERQDWMAAARAIMTTDTFPKGMSAITRIDEAPVHICGIAKGSGMIAPDMGTLLSFIVTDAAIAAPVLQTLLSLEVRHSFNAITVDSDQSTSDMVLLIATGAAAHDPVTRIGDRRMSDFRRQLNTVMSDLALQVVRDGEGAQKLITVTVTGATSPNAARKIAQSIANSPLVKTAIAGSDANWGRIVMAVGKSGEQADRDKLKIIIGGVVVARNGEADPDYKESQIEAHIRGRDIQIEVDVGVGSGEATMWTCDLTSGYIKINADYRS